MTNLNLSKIVEASVNTYENPDMDIVVEQMVDDLSEFSVDIKRIDGDMYKCLKIDGGFINIDDVEPDDGLDFDKFKLTFGENLRKNIEQCVLDSKSISLEDIFKKYGIQYNSMYFYTPAAYNFDSDSLDIKLTLIDEDDTQDIRRTLARYGLLDLVQEYIDTKLQRSYDGYMSFEETNIDEVQWNDYSVLWAILKKENIIDEIKEAIEAVMDESMYELLRDSCNPYYHIKVDGSIDYKTKYKLDGDTNSLLPIE